ncbi:MAG: tagaturonate epimerase family protein [Phycisphaerae bacterium]
MLTTEVADISEASGVEVYPASLVRAEGVIYFVARSKEEKFVGAIGSDILDGYTAGEHDERPIILGPLNHANAEAIRRQILWTNPKAMGRGVSMSFGDLLGAAASGHVRMLAEHGSGVSAALAQLSLAEVMAAGRPAQEVLDAATWGVLQQGHKRGFSAVALDVRSITDVNAAVRGGYTAFILNPCENIPPIPAGADTPQLAAMFGQIDFDTLETTGEDLAKSYVDRPLELPDGTELLFDGPTFVRTLAKMGPALVSLVTMARHLEQISPDNADVMVTLHETEEPTSPHEHHFIAAEMKRLGVRIAGMGLHVPGLEEVVPYTGDRDAARQWTRIHAGIMRRNGPYKIILSPGANKLHLLGIMLEETDRQVHLQVMGATWLDALRTVAAAEPDLFRDIYAFAIESFPSRTAGMRVSADADRLPSLPDEGVHLHPLLQRPDVRQVLYVCFPAVLTGQGGKRFRQPIYHTLLNCEELFHAFLNASFSPWLDALAG